MTVADTSVEAYRSLADDEKITVRAKIYALLEELHPAPLNNREISKILRLPINSVTGRVNEMMEEGIVIRVGKSRDSVTGRMAYCLTIKGGDQ